jgi:hypothetical protein
MAVQQARLRFSGSTGAELEWRRQRGSGVTRNLATAQGLSVRLYLSLPEPARFVFGGGAALAKYPVRVRTVRWPGAFTVTLIAR